jgi:hypothetical protein
LFRRGDYKGRNSKKKKTLLGLSPDEYVGFKVSVSYDIERYVSNDQGYDKLSGNKD